MGLLQSSWRDLLKAICSVAILALGGSAAVLLMFATAIYFGCLFGLLAPVWCE